MIFERILPNIVLMYSILYLLQDGGTLKPLSRDFAALFMAAPAGARLFN